MPIHNSDIARIFNTLADLLEIQEANQFRVRAYRDAARTVGGLSQSAADMVERGEDLTELSGIGRDLAGKIAEIVQTGKLGLLEKMEKEVPRELSELSRISGLGPKRVKVLYEKLGIRTLSQMEKAAKDGSIRELKGFGEKTEENILEGIVRLTKQEERWKISVVDEIAKRYVEYLKNMKGIKDIEAAGSFRRRKETVGDLDILVTHRSGVDVMDRFTGYEDVEKIISKGKTKSSVRLRSGLQVDLRSVPQVGFGAALHYFTGSKAHNIAVRKMGVRKKLKINEYGVFRNNKRVGGRTEEEVFKFVDLPFIEPELREDRGEIEAAQKGSLPKLITLRDVRGDLHAHTKRTDGHNSLEEMVEAAKGHGYLYIAITEHSQHVTVARGLKAKGVSEHIKAIDKANKKLAGITILKGIEVDILEDGTLDLPDDILKELDIVVCSVHYKFNLSRKKQTERIIRAMDNPCFQILGHLSGRLIGERDPYDVDTEAVMQAAAERGCVLELNAYPDRLDITDTDCKAAKEMGVKVAISTDAHGINDLKFMRYGIGQARRGWLEAEDVVNTRSLKELLKLLKRR